MLNRVAPAMHTDRPDACRFPAGLLPAGLRVLGIMMMIGLMVLMASGTSMAQQDPAADVFPNFSLGNFGTPADDTEPVTWVATYQSDGTGKGTLQIEAELADHWH